MEEEDTENHEFLTENDTLQDLILQGKQAEHYICEFMEYNSPTKRPRFVLEPELSPSSTDRIVDYSGYVTRVTEESKNDKTGKISSTIRFLTHG
eukprot:gene3926-4476_t